jgi:hypothetical protein
VLRGDGTLWLNLGDSFAGAGAGGGGNRKGNEHGQHDALVGTIRGTVPVGLKPKDLVGIPWRVAFALQADGWWLRQDIIWHKPNPMPESVTDRCTKAHEYMFLLAKSARYYYDSEAIKEASTTAPHAPGNTAKRFDKSGTNSWKSDRMDSVWGADGTRNRRSVWTVTTKPYREAHFATFPPKLIEPCILASTSEKGCCPRCGAPWERVWEHGDITSTGGGNGRELSGQCLVGGRGDSNVGKFVCREHRTTGWQPTCDCGDQPVPCTVLDPFNGSGTTGAVAVEHGRNYIGIELNPAYIDMAKRRIQAALSARAEQLIPAA